MKLENSLAAGRLASGAGDSNACHLLQGFLAQPHPKPGLGPSLPGAGGALPRFPHPQPGRALARTPLLCLRLGFTKATYIPEGLIRFWKLRPAPSAYLRLDRRGTPGLPTPHSRGWLPANPPLKYACPCPFFTERCNNTAFRNPRVPSTLLQLTLALPI